MLRPSNRTRDSSPRGAPLLEVAATRDEARKKVVFYVAAI